MAKTMMAFQCAGNEGQSRTIRPAFGEQDGAEMIDVDAVIVRYHLRDGSGA